MAACHPELAYRRIIMSTQLSDGPGICILATEPRTPDTEPLIFLLVGNRGVTMYLDEAMSLAKDLDERAARSHHSSPVVMEIGRLTWEIPPDAAARIATGLVHEVEGARTGS